MYISGKGEHLILKTDKLSKSYGKLKAVNELELTVKRGSVYGLLGLNGAGKTTIMLILSTLTRPSCGEAYICGHRLSKESNKVREKIGLLPQDARLHGSQTVKGMLSYLASFRGLSGKSKKQEVEALIKALELEEHSGKRLDKLSHGQHRLVSVGQSFLGSPDLILLDEPFAGLDPYYRNIVRRLIDSYKGKTTILLSTHLLDEVEFICTDVGILHKGRLLRQQKIAEFRKKEYFMLVEAAGLSDKIIKKLKSIEAVKDVSLEGHTLTVEMQKDISSLILKKLLDMKVNIMSFEKGLSAKDIFLDTIENY